MFVFFFLSLFFISLLTFISLPLFLPPSPLSFPLSPSPYQNLSHSLSLSLSPPRHRRRPTVSGSCKSQAHISGLNPQSFFDVSARIREEGHIYVGLNCLYVQWLLTQRTSCASGKSVIVPEEEREGRGEGERDYHGIPWSQLGREFDWLMWGAVVLTPLRWVRPCLWYARKLILSLSLSLSLLSHPSLSSCSLSLLCLLPLSSHLIDSFLSGYRSLDVRMTGWTWIGRGRRFSYWLMNNASCNIFYDSG